MAFYFLFCPVPNKAYTFQRLPLSYSKSVGRSEYTTP
ncbi:hypothetical protein D046_4218A, partial [Vibrio parahaemolyticus V-223/04]